MKISTIIDFPRIEPIDWDLWWKFWDLNALPITKIATNHNPKSGKWIGFDCYRSDKFKDTSNPYVSSFADCRHLIPSLYDFIESIGLDIHLVRILENKSPFYPHKDHTTENFSIRTLLYSNNERPTFYYFINGKKIYQHLPTETNTWIYNDYKVFHGSDLISGFRKILITYQGNWNKSDIERFFASNQYSSYNIDDDKLSN